MSEMVYTFQGGRRRVVVTSITLVNNTTLTVAVLVPADHRWHLLSAKLINCDDVIRDLTIKHFLEVAQTNLIKNIAFKTGVTVNSALQFPNATTGAAMSINFPALIMLEGAEVIDFIYTAGGVSAGGAKADGLVFEYLEVMP